MHYVIFGAGGIGAGIGAQLAKQEHRVTLIARGRHLEAMQQSGLRLRTPDGDEILRLAAVGHPSEVDFGNEAVVVLLTMKSQDTWQALLDLRPHFESVTGIVAAQNGVANERLVARVFDRVYGMFVYMPAQFLEPGVVVLHGTPIRGILDCGVYPAGTDALIEAVCADLESSGFEAEASTQVMRLKYGKLLGNLRNAVQALCGSDAAAGDIIRALRQEAVACYEAAGIDFMPRREMRERFASRYSMGEVAGAPRLGGSTWQSLRRAAGTLETDYLNGEIALLGRQYGIPTPYNRALQQLAEAHLRAGRPPGAVEPSTIIEVAERISAGEKIGIESGRIAETS